MKSKLIWLRLWLLLVCLLLLWAIAIESGLAAGPRLGVIAYALLPFLLLLGTAVQLERMLRRRDLQPQPDYCGGEGWRELFAEIASSGWDSVGPPLTSLQDLSTTQHFADQDKRDSVALMQVPTRGVALALTSTVSRYGPEQQDVEVRDRVQTTTWSSAGLLHGPRFLEVHPRGTTFQSLLLRHRERCQALESDGWEVVSAVVVEEESLRRELAQFTERARQQFLEQPLKRAAAFWVWRLTGRNRFAVRES